MKFFILISLFFLFNTSWVHFTPKSGDYSFEINPRATYLRQEIDKGYIEKFQVIRELNTTIADYVISVSKINFDEECTFEELSSYVFKKNFLNRCGCEITEVRKVHFKNFKSLVFKIRIAKKNGYMAGESVHITKGNIIYSVLYLTEESLVPKFKAEFEHTINSMQIHK
ncbi:MAG: hypothetical protein H0X63_09320 [Flavobacteriales bacterium]|nr:hypothetical protein [Flavobacteriales bacterium]